MTVKTESENFVFILYILFSILWFLISARSIQRVIYFIFFFRNKCVGLSEENSLHQKLNVLGIK